MDPSISRAPLLLDQVVDYRHPDALMVDFERHSDLCYTISVIDSDYSTSIWRANMNVYGGWTLAPVDVSPDNEAWWNGEGKFF